MPELERMLSQLGRELDWPDTPDLPGRVGARLLAPQGGPRRPKPLFAGFRLSLIHI